MYKLEKYKFTIKKKEMALGVSLMLFTLIIPSFFNTQILGIYTDIYKALAELNSFYIIVASFKLVILNSVRGLPHYLGAFYLAQSIKVYSKNTEVKWIRVIIICGTIPIIYLLVAQLYDIQYDFGGPAILVIAMVVFLGKINFDMVNKTKKSLSVITILMAFQWLDVMPSLTQRFFGRGETSLDIKKAAIIIGCVDVLQFLSLMFFTIMFVNALLFCKLIIDQNNLMAISKENQRNQQIIMETQIRELETRNYMELQNLVHDLKSPLTAMQALVGVVKLQSDVDKDNFIYLTKIEQSVERMSEMISEILYEDKKSEIYTFDLMLYIMSQISTNAYSSMVELHNSMPKAIVVINRIRFTRAIINILENAFFACRNVDCKIEICISAINEKQLKISIIDNGEGISSEKINTVFEKGYSGKGSLGYGLSFVKKVVEDNNGNISIESTVGVGTTVDIILPFIC